MGISKATEYSLRAMVYMAMNPNEEVITKNEICDTQSVTPGFLTKIMQPLIKKGFVKSFRGAKGGFGLAKDPKEITVYEIIDAIDNLLWLNECLIGDGTCRRDKVCFMHTVWEEAKFKVEDIIKRYTLADIAREQIKLLSMFAEKK